MSLNERLTKIVQEMQDNLTGWYDLLTESEKEEIGEEKNWSIKDELFHNMIWAGRRITILETIEHGQSWTDIDYGDFEEENRTIFEEHKLKSWEEAQDLISSTYGKITDYIDRTSEDTMLSIPEGQEQEIWRTIAGSFVLHPMIHLWGYLIKKQDLEKLLNLFGESFANQLLSVHDSEDWQAGVYYNLACIYALSGDNKKSIERFETAIKINPDLKQWASQDSDLEAIRNEPVFQALIKN